MSLTLLIVLGVFIAIAVTVAFVWRQADRVYARRAEYIRTYRFPAFLAERLKAKHPALSPRDVDRVFRALRQYFLACLHAKATSRNLALGMPSRVVDDLWHEFMLASRDYTAFCKRAFGGYLHHTPDTNMKSPMTDALANTLQALRGSQRRLGAGRDTEALVAGIPLLFAIDSALAIEGGFTHSAETVAAIEAKRQAAAQGHAASCGGGSSCGASIGCGRNGGSDAGDSSGSCSGGSGCSGGCSSD